ncbi:dipeptidase, partial [Actinoplanes sp. TFC3]|uniref:dipeptidase n=1 Tax=Actinoplanes sp. TFC3 TaxID=1710355 RepID=UPI0009E7A5B0
MPVIDGHNDLPMALRARAGYRVAGLAAERPEFHTDIARLRAGGVGGQFWSVYVPSDLPEPEAVAATMEQVDAVYRLVAAYPSELAIARTAADVTAAIASGRIASLIGIEGGHSIASSLGVLRSFARLGVRYMTLTHNNNTTWADSAVNVPGAAVLAAGTSAASASPRGVSAGGVSAVGASAGGVSAGGVSAVGASGVGGLNDEGRAVVAEMQRIGMLVDLSHVATATMHAALDIATAPVIFSHSSARAICDHRRNAPDEVLVRLKENEGICMATFVPSFVSPEVAAWSDAADAEWSRLGLPTDPWP